MNKIKGKNWSTKNRHSLFCSASCKKYWVQFFLKERGCFKCISLTILSRNKYKHPLNCLLDKVCNKEIYKNNNILSVNQLNCQIKLKEVWKSINDVNYPIQWKLKSPPAEDARTTRSENGNNLVESRLMKCEESTFMNDAARIWNLAPQTLKDCKNIYSVKREIKKYIVTLPL